jgi:hypothetical protein
LCQHILIRRAEKCTISTTLRATKIEKIIFSFLGAQC